MSEDEKRYDVVSHNLPKVDGEALARGRRVFLDDIENSPELVAGILTSPLAHAEIVDIDTSRAEKLPGVESILHYGNVPRVPHTTAGQGYP
ncbi:MAG: aldehyde oxidase, partial [Candidatus Bipolaricaulota bacterium]